MKLRNGFSESDRYLFSDAWECWYCGMNTCDSLHHIMGRGSMASTVESSILNAAPICNHKCHLKHHGQIMTEEWQRKLLKKTHDYLVRNGYVFTDKDNDFILKYKKMYDLTHHEQ